MAAFSSDELKYMKAIADYRAKKISYSDFLDITLKLRDIRRHIKDSHTMTGRKFSPRYNKGGKVKMSSGGSPKKKSNLQQYGEVFMPLALGGAAVGIPAYAAYAIASDLSKNKRRKKRKARSSRPAVGGKILSQFGARNKFGKKPFSMRGGGAVQKQLTYRIR